MFYSPHAQQLTIINCHVQYLACVVHVELVEETNNSTMLIGKARISLTMTIDTSPVIVAVPAVAMYKLNNYSHVCLHVNAEERHYIVLV